MVGRHPGRAGEQVRRSPVRCFVANVPTPVAHHGPAPRQAPAQGHEAVRSRRSSSRSTPSSSTSPTRPSSTSQLPTRWRSGPSPSSPPRDRALRRSLLDSFIAEYPSGIEGLQVDGGSSSGPEFEHPCRARPLPSSSCRERPFGSTTTSNAPKASWRIKFYGVEDLPVPTSTLPLGIGPPWPIAQSLSLASAWQYPLSRLWSVGEIGPSLMG